MPADHTSSVLVLTRQIDDHADIVCEALRSRGLRAARVETASFPDGFAATARFSHSGIAGEIRLADGSVDLDDVISIWNRRPEMRRSSDPDPASDAAFQERESRFFLTGLFDRLKGRHWVNPWYAQIAAEHKLNQLGVAAQCGLEIPATLVTNDPKECLEFFDRCENQVIYKPLGFHFRQSPKGNEAIFTNLVQRRDLAARLHQVASAPCIFQQFIPKRVELRATVVGDEIFTLEIDATSSERGRVDWRHYDFAHTQWRRAELAPDTSSRILELMHQLGLVFGCVDLIVTPAGRTIFLEVNPAGQWYWVENITGWPILERLVDELQFGPSRGTNSPPGSAVSSRPK